MSLMKKLDAPRTLPQYPLALGRVETLASMAESTLHIWLYTSCWPCSLLRSTELGVITMATTPMLRPTPPQIRKAPLRPYVSMRCRMIGPPTRHRPLWHINK